MSTEPAPPSPKDDFAQIETQSVPTKLDDSIAILQTQLQQEIDQRREERFVWVLATVLLVACLAFPHLSIGAAFIVGPLGLGLYLSQVGVGIKEPDRGVQRVEVYDHLAEHHLRRLYLSGYLRPLAVES